VQKPSPEETDGGRQGQSEDVIKRHYGEKNRQIRDWLDGKLNQNYQEINGRVRQCRKSRRQLSHDPSNMA
jgi:hypothetical protein